MTIQSEQVLEEGLIKTLVSMNYEPVQIADEAALEANFRQQLEKHNKTEFTHEEFRKILIHLESGSIFDKAAKLRDRFSLTRADGTVKWVEFFNTREWCKNQFQVVNQISDQGRRNTRYDVTLLINGLPLVQIELKRRGIELKQAYNQIQRYHKTAYTGLFQYIQLFVISNGVNTRYFANNPNAGYKFTFPWSDMKNNHINQLDIFAAMFFEKCTLSKIIAKYIVLHQSDKCLMVLRPYQYYAVEALIDRVQNSNKNGYIWHTTGSGKTLTSFKSAQLIADMPEVDKVMFVVDRHDLDTQTKKEYDAFCPGAVDSTDNTNELVKALKSNKRFLLTTIQKLNHAVQRDYYNAHLEEMKHQNIIMIFDECHRSQFGDMHKNITGYFTNIRYFGFTGTPIFVANANNKRTTKDIFGDRLHEYLIKDAIADENVLGFLVEYHGVWHRTTDDDHLVRSIDVRGAYNQDKRLHSIVNHIIGSYNQDTYDRDFNAIFAVHDVPTLIQYYKLFKAKNPDMKIATIFTYASNEDTEDELTGLNEGFVNERTTRDELDEFIGDYNAMFGTKYNTDNFNLYYDDVSKRMKNRQIDLLIVVNMFLTGFDAKRLNTLYLDKNLRYHGLIQAYSRTNRVLNEKKKYGKIVSFRDLKEQTDEAIRLFSNTDSAESVLMRPYVELEAEYNALAQTFLSIYPTVQGIDELQTEDSKRDFILAFRNLLRLRTRMSGYDEFIGDDLALPSQPFLDYQSKYLDMANTIPGKPGGDDKESILNDIDFELELIRRDLVNVSYIISLLEELDPESASFAKDRKNIIDTMNGDPVMRSKAKLIDDFIKVHYDGKSRADLPDEVGTELDAFFMRERNRALDKLAEQEGVEKEFLDDYISEYEYLGKPKPDIIKGAVEGLGLSFIKRREKIAALTKYLSEIIKLFSWE